MAAKIGRPGPRETVRAKKRNGGESDLELTAMIVASTEPGPQAHDTGLSAKEQDAANNRLVREVYAALNADPRTTEELLDALKTEGVDGLMREAGVETFKRDDALKKEILEIRSKTTTGRGNKAPGNWRALRRKRLAALPLPSGDSSIKEAKKLKKPTPSPKPAKPKKPTKKKP